MMQLIDFNDMSTHLQFFFCLEVRESHLAKVYIYIFCVVVSHGSNWI